MLRMWDFTHKEQSTLYMRVNIQMNMTNHDQFQFN